MEKIWGVDQKELERILQKVEIPCTSDKAEGFFTDTTRLKRIDEEIRNSMSHFQHISGRKYYRLYGRDTLPELAKRYNNIVVVSSHADNKHRQTASRYEDKGETIKGIFDNAATNAVCTYILKYADDSNLEIPPNVLFAFTADEEENCIGAKRVAKKLKEFWNEDQISVIVLDATYGWQDGADFTIENDFIYKRNDKDTAGEKLIKKICEITGESKFKWNYLAADEDYKEDNPQEYIPSKEIAGWMPDGCKRVGVADGPDETSEYDEHGFSTLSICLPSSADEDTMHSPDGFEISKIGLKNYTDFLIRVLKDINLQLPKLQIHFGDEIMYVPQTKWLNTIIYSCSGVRSDKTLKECIIENYKLRTAREMKKQGKKISYSKVKKEEAEAQIISDLKAYGSNYVYEEAWNSGYIDIFGDGCYTNYNWQGHEDEVYEWKIE